MHTLLMAKPPEKLAERRKWKDNIQVYSGELR
jgi:hypothetical protein